MALAALVSPTAPEPAVAPARPKLAMDATCALGKLEVQGSLPDAPVRRALERLWGDLRGCYRTAAERAGGAGAARLSVGLVIDEDGRARRPRVTGSGPPGLRACVDKTLRRARSRSRPDTGTVEVSFELRYTPVRP